MLWDVIFKDFVMLDKVSEADGFGGIKYTYQEGASFKAAAARNSSTEMKIAEQTGAKVIYNVIVPQTITLKQNDTIKRTADGLALRVTSDSSEMHTPAFSGLNCSQCDAEVVTV